MLLDPAAASAVSKSPNKQCMQSGQDIWTRHWPAFDRLGAAVVCQGYL